MRTQIDPNEPWWFGLDDDELNAVWPWEEWVLARSLVGPIPAHREETDLFQGVRSSVVSDAMSSSERHGHASFSTASSSRSTTSGSRVPTTPRSW